jgi:phosphonate transport system permease protein
VKLVADNVALDATPPIAPATTHVWLTASIAVACFLLLAQALVVVKARPQEIITGVGGMADLLRRATPPNFALIPEVVWPTLETLDAAIFGTFFGMLFALPLAIFAARNVTPSPYLYAFARGTIGLTRAVPDLIWALLFVTAVGLGPFPGALALAVHSVGMLGRLFAEVIEDIDMGPVESLTLTGASRLQVFSHAVVPGVAPALLGIALYRLDENVRASLVLGFVGAGGIGFQILSAMNLFQYRDVSMYLLLTFALVVVVERLSATLRKALV